MAVFTEGELAPKIAKNAKNLENAKPLAQRIDVLYKILSFAFLAFFAANSWCSPL
jgi:hypothetical protein